MALKRINIFKYDNFRKYLQDIYNHNKGTKSRFTFREFSKVAGFSSSSFLKLVMQGHRNLSDDTIKIFTQVLKLKSQEALFFRALVKFNQAKTTVEKRKSAEVIFKFRRFSKHYPLILSEFEYLSKWYFVPIRELLNHPEFREDPKWIAKQLSPRILAKEAASALKVLRKIGLIGKERKGKFKQARPHVDVPPDLNSTMIKMYHREMIKLGADSIDNHPSKEREVSATTMAISDEVFLEIKSRIIAFHREITDLVNRSGGGRRVFQLNFQLFPLTRAKGLNDKRVKKYKSKG